MIRSKSGRHALGQLIRLKRENRMWTQNRLAKECRTGTQFISNIERGLCAVPIPLMRRLTAALNIDVEEVLILASADLRLRLGGER